MSSVLSLVAHTDCCPSLNDVSVTLTELLNSLGLASGFGTTDIYALLFGHMHVNHALRQDRPRPWRASSSSNIYRLGVLSYSPVS